MVDNEQGITRRTFLKYVDREILTELEYMLGYAQHPKQGLTMAADWHVGYYKSYYWGRPCVFFRWSAMEYVFVN
jgi:hypothetical protein